MTIPVEGALKSIAQTEQGILVPVTVQDVYDALVTLGGEGHISEIEARVRAVGTEAFPPAMQSTIRARLQENSPSARQFQGRRDLFRSVNGVKKRDGLWRLTRDGEELPEPDYMMDDAEGEAREGAVSLRQHLSRERSRSLIRKFKNSLDSPRCSVCDFDFFEFYGKLGKGYIEAHHTIPVATLTPEHVTRVGDLKAVCSNCHRMLHRNGLMDWRALRQVLQEQRSKK